MDNDKRLIKIKQKEVKPEKSFNTIKYKFLKKSIPIWASSVFLIIIVFSFFGLITWMLQKSNLPKWDLSINKAHSITKDSKKCIKQLTDKVEIYFFYKDESDGTKDLKDFLNNYTRESKLIKVYYANPEKDLALAQKYELGTESNSLIFQGKAKFKAVDLMYLDQKNLEQLCTSALVDVNLQNSSIIYVLGGHEEFNLTGRLIGLKEDLVQESIDTKQLELQVLSEVPKDAGVVVIAAPNKDISEDDYTKLKKYADNGGNLIVLNELRAKAQYTNLNKLLKDTVSATIEKNVILEEDNTKRTPQSKLELMPEIIYNEYTKDIISKGLKIIYPLTSSINLPNDQESTNNKISINRLFKTSNKAWARTDFTIANETKLDSEKQGQFVIGAILEKTISNDKKSKVAIFGSSLFAQTVKIQNTQLFTVETDKRNSYYYREGNASLLLNMIKIMINRESTINISKAFEEPKFTQINPNQFYIILIVIFTIPLIIFITGILVWMRRNKR